MQQLRLALVLLLGVCSHAAAADRSAAPTAQWGGFYIGGHVGYGSARASADYAVLGIPFISGAEELNGAVYGGQLGYNFQFGQLVLGVETDISATSQKATASRLCSVPACLLAVTQTSDDSVPWLGSTRLRAGYAIGAVMFYGTGGVGYGSFKSTQTLTSALASVTTVISEQRTAWVAGGGMEAALGPRWSMRAEYLHFDSAESDTTYAFAGLGLVTTKGRMSEDMVRLGVNYRF